MLGRALFTAATVLGISTVSMKAGSCNSDLCGEHVQQSVGISLLQQGHSIIKSTARLQRPPQEEKTDVALSALVTTHNAADATGSVATIDLFEGDNLCGGACSDHMVLEATGSQLWGFGASAGLVVTVSVDGDQVATGEADAGGSWKLFLPARTAGTGHAVRLEAEGRSRTLTDVAFGAVILCGGQSNMLFEVRATPDASNVEIPDAVNYPDIRLMHLCDFLTDPATGKGLQNFCPWNGSDQTWARVSPSTVPSFAAVCYYSARETYKGLVANDAAMPIGLVDTSISGSSIRAWLSDEAIKSCTDADICATLSSGNCSQGRNAAIVPILPMRLRTVLWYQGESDAGVPDSYACFFPALIRDWRAGFEQPELPFYFVELAPPMGPWIRQAQRSALLLERVGFTTAFDLGCAPPKDTGCYQGIHPARKQELGRRLSLLLLDEVFGWSMPETSGPQLLSAHATEGDDEHVVATLRFSHARGLHLNGTADCAFATDKSKGNGVDPSGPCCAVSPFIFSASDGSWVRSDVPHISGGEVTVTARVPGGLAAVGDIAYAYEHFPLCALYSADSDAPSGPDSHNGLVATPFRRSLRDGACPSGSSLCAAAGAHPHVTQAQCCGPVGQQQTKQEQCVAGLGCYGGQGLAIERPRNFST